MATPCNLFTHKCTIRRATTSQDSSNFTTKTFANHIVNQPCRIQPMSMTESIRYGGESTRRMWRIFIKPLDVKQTDQIRFVDKTTGTAVTRDTDIQEIMNRQLGNDLLSIAAQETG